MDGLLEAAFMENAGRNGKSNRIGGKRNGSGRVFGMCMMNGYASSRPRMQMMTLLKRKY